MWPHPDRLVDLRIGALLVSAHRNQVALLSIGGIDLAEALRMASLYPAEAVGQAGRLGRLKEGYVANIVALSDALDVKGVWIDGRRVFGG